MLMSDTPESRRQRLEAIAERLAKATPGEWRKGDYLAVRGQTDTVATFVDGEWNTHIATVFPVQIGWQEGEDLPTPIDAEDAEFIAHAHQDVPWLLSELTRLESSLTQARELMREAASVIENGCSYASTPCADRPDCIISKLRETAKQEDRTDG